MFHFIPAGALAQPRELPLNGARALFGDVLSYAAAAFQDPVLLVMAAHLVFGWVHFVTWAAAYGSVDGAGPRSGRTAEFDDIVIGLTGLFGWTGGLYFLRAQRGAGALAVLLERCGVDVAKAGALFWLFDLAFTTAFYPLARGTAAAASGGAATQGLDAGHRAAVSNLGYGFIQLYRFAYGEAEWEAYADANSEVKKAFATMLFFAYGGVALLLVANLLTALVVRTTAAQQAAAAATARCRWAAAVLGAERRLFGRLREAAECGTRQWDAARGRHQRSVILELPAAEAAAAAAK